MRRFARRRDDKYWGYFEEQQRCEVARIGVEDGWQIDRGALIFPQMREANFDGLVGPSHNYAGLSAGNLASKQHQGQVSSPKRAAQQGLLKMKRLADLGVGQCVLPPLVRPRLDLLRALGWNSGRLDAVPTVELARVYSASSMWTANAGTVVPSADTTDGKLHIVVANLFDRAHRAIEASDTLNNLQQIFADPALFRVHAPLPLAQLHSDEGAANHTRFVAGTTVGAESLHLFVYGRDGEAQTKFPARQTRAASEAVARLSQLKVPTLFLQQSRRAIDAGVFHNDVISVGFEDRYFAHEATFESSDAVAELERAAPWLRIGIVGDVDLPLAEAVTSYLFNSQIVRTAENRVLMLCPSECQSQRVQAVLQRWVADGLLDAFMFVDLRESMKNGGGPACLRLRVAMTDDEYRSLSGNVKLNGALFSRLWQWTEGLRDAVSPSDLHTTEFAQHCFERTCAVYDILGLRYPGDTR